MNDIDPEKLEEAIRYCDGTATVFGRIVLEAARAHLATLPRFKEVEVVQWAVMHADGTVDSVWRSHEQAQSRVREGFLRSIVRLTGTAKVKVQG